MLERWPGEEVRLGRWVLPGGVSVELDARKGGLWRGSPLTEPRLCAALLFLSHSLSKRGSLRPPVSPPSRPASSSPFLGGGAEGEIRQQRGTS